MKNRKIVEQCNTCGQKLNIPFDRGDLYITCPSCKNKQKWEEKSIFKKSNEYINQLIEAKVEKIMNYTPKVGVFGVTGVGKSSLCNALFGKDMAEISDIKACTRRPQEILINKDGSDKGIILIDVPGVSETIERDKEYYKLYESLMPELDLVIWVVKADDRAYKAMQEVYNDILKKHIKRCPVIFVVNQVDKVNPMRQWDIEKNQPGPQQLENIEIKINEISKAVFVDKHLIIPASVAEKYNLLNVMSLIIDVLPNEKKYSFAREAEEDCKNEEIEEKAKKGIWDSIKEFAQEVWDEHGDKIKSAVKTGIEMLVNRIPKFW